MAHFQMLDPGTQLCQMMTPVAHTLRANDPGEWKSLMHLLRSVSQSRYDFCPRAAELLSQLRNKRRTVCGRYLPVDLLSLFQGSLPRGPRAGLEFPYLLRGALLPMRQMPKQVLSGPFPRHADHLHLLLAERVKTGEQLIENAAFLLDQHRRFQHLGPFLAHRRQAFYSFCDDDRLFPDTDCAPAAIPAGPAKSPNVPMPGRYRSPVQIPSPT